MEAAYREGVFPMGDERGDVYTWHKPVWRGVLPLDSFHISHSLTRTLRAHRYEMTVNRDFDGVVSACAAGREVWISDGLKRAYTELHRRGKAHSVEIWADERLAGGVYGIHLGGAFFAESKFHLVRDMSKIALAELARRLWDRGFALLDVQYWTPHLSQFGAQEISNREYQRRLKEALRLDCRFAD